MYSDSSENSLNSLKLCECDNNNLCSVKIMNNILNEVKQFNGITNFNNNVSKKALKTVEVRREEVLAIKNRFPTKIPIIVQRYHKETQLPPLDKAKFLVPQDITMSQFQIIIRNRIRLNPQQALYILVNNKSMTSLTLTISQVYAEHANANGFLYITYASQEVFGNCTTKSNNNSE
ncbi:microtubule-associated proteins 1A/1B light chain 3C-like [Diorhabda carinulata]|uniref:microtubule-associated proteins 1A/1B light chain 3C-like n=1 Tax=Diorhabda carinulata TaxID=1163345 RepID=UPI00259FFB24|nr:microtubule-associated proteins 1A/1B light chain 3C-like [Diorhabda carinulata]